MQMPANAGIAFVVVQHLSADPLSSQTERKKFLMDSRPVGYRI
jgi:hypothetical protein